MSEELEKEEKEEENDAWGSMGVILIQELEFIFMYQNSFSCMKIIMKKNNNNSSRNSSNSDCSVLVELELVSTTCCLFPCIFSYALKIRTHPYSKWPNLHCQLD